MKQPWQMTKKEWYDAWYQTEANSQGTGGDTKYGGMGRCTSEKGLKARVDNIMKIRAFLTMNLPSKDRGFGLRRATHRDVVVYALYKKKPVPTKVLKDYPSLMKLRRKK